MTQRIDYRKQSPELLKNFEFSGLRHSTIEESIHDLITSGHRRSTAARSA
jgi:hypothetical protein